MRFKLPGDVPASVLRLAFSLSGKILVAADDLYRVHAWDAQTGNQMWMIQHDRRITCLQTAKPRKMNHVILGDEDGNVYIFRGHDGSVVRGKFWPDCAEVRTLSLSPDHSILVLGLEHEIGLWGYPELEGMRYTDHACQVGEFSPSSHYIRSVCPISGKVGIYDFMVTDQRFTVSQSPGVHMSWRPDRPHTFLIINPSGDVFEWEVGSDPADEPIGRIELMDGFCSATIGQRHIALTDHTKSTVRIYSLKGMGRAIKETNLTTGYADCLTFSPNGNALAFVHRREVNAIHTIPLA